MKITIKISCDRNSFKDDATALRIIAGKDTIAFGYLSLKTVEVDPQHNFSLYDENGNNVGTVEVISETTS
jgi:hypothetical protein